MYIIVSSTLPRSCRLTVTRRVFLVVKDMFTLATHLSLPPILCRVWVAQSLVFCVVFCRSLYVLLSLFFQQLHCMSFDLRFLISSEIVWIVNIIVWVRGAHMSKNGQRHYLRQSEIQISHMNMKFTKHSFIAFRQIYKILYLHC
jgi:hypothetical protein